MSDERTGRRRMPTLRRPASFRSLYGGHPAHLLLLIATIALAGFAVSRWLAAPTPVRLLVWFAAAVIAHDLIAFPIYTGLDRLFVRVVAGADPGPVLGKWRRAAINHVRIPVFLSLLLFLMWYPLILKRSDGAYFAASGHHQDPYLSNWLLAVAIIFGGSLLIFIGRLALAGGRARSAASQPQTSPPESNSAPSGPGSSQQ